MTVVDPPIPSLSVQLRSFAPADPGGWQAVLDLAQVADAAGVDRVVVSDHIAFGEQLDAYADPRTGGIAGGTQPTGPDGHWLEPMTLLAVLAGRTTRVRLGTAILLAALRRPAVLAKEAATLDVLSGGRLDLGVGVGWQREEYEVCGLDYSRRGDLLDHTLAVCSTLWREPSGSYEDSELRFDRIHAMPKPLQPGGVPIWVSGRVNRRTLARLVRFGTGWIPWGDHIADPAPGIAEVRRAFDAAGRDPAILQVQGSLPSVGDATPVALESAMEQLGPLLDAGVTDFRLRHPLGEDPARDAEVLQAVVGAFRAATGRPVS